MDGLTAGHNAKLNKSLSWIDLGVALLVGALPLTTQVCGTRLAVQFFGSDSSTIAAMIVAALFGLGSGAAILGRASDSFSRTDFLVGLILFVSGGLSVSLSIWGGAIANVFDGGNDSINHLAAKLGFAIVTLTPINFAMGGLLPVLVMRRHESLKQRFGSMHAGDSVGLIYALESCGAALGSIATAFLLIQTFGIQDTLLWSGLVSIAIAAVYFVVAAFRTREQSRPSETTLSYRLNRQDWILLIAVGLTSCASLGMEVVWQRFFVVWFGSDTQSFALVVSAILSGVSLGSFLAAQIVNRVKSLEWLYSRLLYWVALTVVGSCYVVVFGNDNLESWIWSYKYLTAFPVASRLVLAFAIVAAPMTLIGMCLPVAAHLWIRKTSGIGGQVGQIFGVALFGNIVGVFVCGVWLVPAFGLRPTAIALSGLCLLASIGIRQLLLTGTAVRSSRITLGRWGTVAGVVVWVVVANGLVSRKSELGLVSNRTDWRTLFYSENSQNTVAVIGSVDDSRQRQMLIDGVAIGEIGGGVDEKQQLLAHLPLLLRPGITDASVLTIGLGTGVLASELIENPLVANVTCLELSPAVIEAAECFSDVNDDLLRQDDFQLVLGDGIRFLRKTTHRYDTIVSDAKSRPGHAGNVAFFTRDYYQICNSRLTEQGVFVQWISLKSSQHALRTILKSFTKVFPYAHIAIAAPDSIFAVGSCEPIAFDREWVNCCLKKPNAESLSRYHVNCYDDLLSLYWLDQSVIQSALMDVQVNTFDRPVLESFAFDSFRQVIGKSTEQLELVRYLIQEDRSLSRDEIRFNGSSLDSNLALATELFAGRRAGEAIVMANQELLELNDGWLDRAAESYRRALVLLPNLTRQNRVAKFYRQLAERARRDGKSHLEFSALMNLRELNMACAEDELAMAKILVEAGQAETSLDHFYQATKKSPDEPRFRIEFAFCLLKLNRYGQAASQFNRVLSQNSNAAEAKAGLGIAQLKMGRFEAGYENIRAAILANDALKSRLKEFTIDLDSLRLE